MLSNNITFKSFKRFAVVSRVSAPYQAPYQHYSTISALSQALCENAKIQRLQKFKIHLGMSAGCQAKMSLAVVRYYPYN